MQIFWKIFLWLGGWKASGRFPAAEKKYLVLVAPHTSNLDFFLGLAFRSTLGISGAKFLGKQELFRGPLGWWMRWLGGTPVDRAAKQNMVEQVVEKFNGQGQLILALSPEGTRRKVDKLRSGFFHIARQAGIPVVMAGLDFKNRQLVISEPFGMEAGEAAVMEKLVAFFGPLQGKVPAQGLGHLLAVGDKKKAEPGPPL